MTGQDLVLLPSIIGLRVHHPEYGDGEILLSEGEGEHRKVVVHFDHSHGDETERKFILAKSPLRAVGTDEAPTAVAPTMALDERCREDENWSSLVQCTATSLARSAEGGFTVEVGAFRAIGAIIEFLNARGLPTELVDLRSCDYGLYLKTDHWGSVRGETRAAFGERCAVCNSPENIDVHHRTYVNRGCEEFLDTIALCRKCHGMFHDNGRLANPKG